MVVIFLYFSLFLGIHFLAKQFKRPGTARLFQLVACFILLFVFFGFRDITILNDTSHYCFFYDKKVHLTHYKEESIFAFHLTDRFEYGFQVLIHILVKYVSKTPFTLIILSSFIITVGNLWFFNKHSHNIALLCFYMLIASLFFTHYCIIRQAFSIIIFYVAYDYWERGKTGKYYLLIACACLFHYSAAFLFLLPTICKLKFNPRNILITVGTAVAIAANIFLLLTMLGLRDHPYYKTFVQKETLALVGLADLAQIILILAICFLAYKNNKSAQIDKRYWWMCILTLSISLVSTVLYPVARINEYFWPFIILLLAKLTEGNRGWSNLLRLAFVTIFITKLIGVNTFRPEWLHIEPYKFYDFSKKNHNYNLYPQE